MQIVNNMRSVVWWGAATLIGLSVVAPAQATSTRSVYNIAKSVTVRIDGSDHRGSGILINKQGNVYFLATNRHVIKCKDPSCVYTITTPDGQRYSVKTAAIQSSDDLDLAIIKFSSSKNYPIAKLVNPLTIKSGEIVYTAGFPVEAKSFSFGGGEAIAIANKRLVGDLGGYTLIYNAFTNPGMSGGGVFDGQGRLIAIHGHGSRFTLGTNYSAAAQSSAKAGMQKLVGQKIGYNRGIPVPLLINSGLSHGLRSNVGRASNVQREQAQTADELFILGADKFISADERNIKQDKQQALQYFDRAIQVNPNYGYAYFLRSITKTQLADRSEGLDGLKDRMADLAKANQLSGYRYSSPYSSVFIQENQLDNWLKNKNNYDSASKLIIQATTQLQPINGRRKDPQSTTNYRNALRDLDRALQLIPKDTGNPNVQMTISTAYLVRAGVKRDYLQDLPAAQADYRLAIKYYPLTDALAYFSRGSLRESLLQDRTGATADYRKAAELAKQEGNNDLYQTIRQQLDRSSRPSR
jgi:tetratricopeptide (TPR) repeat protein